MFNQIHDQALLYTQKHNLLYNFWLSRGSKQKKITIYFFSVFF